MPYPADNRFKMSAVKTPFTQIRLYFCALCITLLLNAQPHAASQFTDSDSNERALEQALKDAATGRRTIHDSDQMSRHDFEHLDVDDLIWLASMSERLVKRLPDVHYRVRLLRAVLDESRAVGLDPQLVLAVIDVESSFRRDAISKSGAMGLIQVMPFWLSVYDQPSLDLHNPLVSLRFGCNILRHYIDRYDNVRNALAAYNGSLGLSTYPDRIFARYNKSWRYTLSKSDPLSLAANTGPVRELTRAYTDSLGPIELPLSQVALTLRPAPIVTERNPDTLALNDNSIIKIPFYNALSSE